MKASSQVQPRSLGQVLSWKANIKVPPRRLKDKFFPEGFLDISSPEALGKIPALNVAFMKFNLQEQYT